jgi:DNA polymerase IV
VKLFTNITPMPSALRTIAHFDLDCFYVSVELLKNKALIGKPVSVGGGDRGVVLSCSYEARKFGVYGGMPGRQARRLCPELITLHGDMDSYSAFSREVTEIIAGEVPLFEKSSIDEFYIDMTGMDKFFGCAKYTAALRRKIIKKTKLSISYGLSSNKLISKIATNEVKPNGETQVEHGKERSFLAPLPVDKMPMIGKQTANLLRSIGIDTLGELSETSTELLTRLIGKNGEWLWRRANGIDDSPVISYREAKSIGTESTFQEDTSDALWLKRQLIRMTEKVAFELRDSNKLAGCITVKVRYHDFRTVTKQHVIPYSCADHVLQESAKQLFDKLYEQEQLVRLIGVRLSDLVPGNYQIHMFDDTIQSISLYQAIDAIKHKFGEKILTKAAGLRI